MGANCVPLVADMFLFCYEVDFMLSLSDKNQAGFERLTIPQDIQMTCLIFRILILNKW